MGKINWFALFLIVLVICITAYNIVKVLKGE
jgi:hypothetical protein